MGFDDRIQNVSISKYISIVHTREHRRVKVNYKRVGGMV